MSADDHDAARTLALRIDAVLPQTQCRRCGEADCRAYAAAVAAGAPIDRCPPGGAEGIARLAAITGRPVVPLDPAVGVEGPLRLALIDEAWCIGCTLCLAACPVDCIVGAPKRMHGVVAAQCTGCELCLPVCPVDCISMVDAPAAADPPPTGWSAWSAARASESRERHAFHRQRLGLDEPGVPHAAGIAADTEGSTASGAIADLRAADATTAPPPTPAPDRGAMIEAALARARAGRAAPG